MARVARANRAAPHKLSGGRSYRRVQETRQSDSSGTGVGSGGNDYLVREEDGTYRFTLEEGSGSLIKEEST